MPVDPHLAEMLAMIQAAGIPPMHEGTPAAARAQHLQATSGALAPEQVVPVGRTEDRSIPGADGDLRARVYWPEGEGTFPVTAFFHGGGWVIGGLDTHDNVVRNICRGSRSIVVSIEYRLAPEHPFPAAVEDAIATSRWLAGHCDEFGGNGRFAVAGDSAGGNLAAVAAQTLHADGIPIAGQLLIYPVTDAGGDYASRSAFGSGYFIDAETGAWFARLYLGDWKDTKDPRLSPLRAADLSGLPPALIITAEFDALRDEGEAYAAALRAAGVDVQSERCAGMIHAFFEMGPLSPAVQKAIDDSCARFGKLLRG